MSSVAAFDMYMEEKIVFTAYLNILTMHEEGSLFSICWAPTWPAQEWFYSVPHTGTILEASIVTN